jgi:hypothetical protein
MDGNIIILTEKELKKFKDDQEKCLKEYLGQIRSLLENSHTGMLPEILFAEDIMRFLRISRSTFERRKNDMPLQRNGSGKLFAWGTDFKVYLKKAFPEYYGQKMLKELQGQDGLVRELCK